MFINMQQLNVSDILRIYRKANQNKIKQTEVN